MNRKFIQKILIFLTRICCKSILEKYEPFCQQYMTLSMIKTIETPQIYPEGKDPHNFQDSYSVGSYIIPILNTCTVFF